MRSLLVVFAIFVLPPVIAQAGKAVVEKSTGEVISWQRYGTPSYDPAKHLIVDSDNPPDRGTTRWDFASNKFRAFTAAENDARKQSRLDEQAEREASQALVRAIVLALKDQFPSLDAQQFKLDFVRHWKSMQAE